DEASARIAEVALPVELADVPRRFGAHAVDRADEVAVGHGVRGLLELPQILGEARDGRRRVEHDLRAVQPEDARAFGEVTVVTDVDADSARGGLKDRIARVARTEIVLLPETRRDLRDVMLAILAEIPAVGVDDGRRVVVDAGVLDLVDRQD